MQTKLQSFKETVLQTAIGFGVAIASQVVIFPFFDVNLPFSDNLLIGMWFTLISIVRGYVVRRFFNNKHYNENTDIRQVLEEAVKLNGELLLALREKEGVK